MIKCHNICLSFNNKPLFVNFSFEVNKGEVFTLSGNSGKGKSTLLKILQGYVVADRGKVVINGIELLDSHMGQIRDLLVWIPQNVNLPVENGMQLIELMHVSDNVVAIKKILSDLGLSEDFLQKDFHKISGGQKQRVIIAICLSIDKPIVLMDEPTSSLDDSSIRYLLQTLRKMKHKTFVTASHNKTWIDHSDRVIVLD